VGKEQGSKNSSEIFFFKRNNFVEVDRAKFLLLAWRNPIVLRVCLDAKKVRGKNIIVLLDMTFRLVVDEILHKSLYIRALECS
jgi:hypothetical protein